jgi:uncharacterized protein (TIGR03437 family)
MPIAIIAGIVSPVISCTLSPQYPGVYQVVVQVPSGLPPGTDQPVQIYMIDSSTNASANSTNLATIATQ